MWTCPKCGREFTRKNQGHYCGEAPKTVTEYIRSQPSKAQSHLKQIATIIKKSVPDVKECILWSMPTYEKAGKAISFAACKNHISLYVGEETIEKFADEVIEYQTKKSAIYIPYDCILPSQLLETIVKFCFYR